uniref:Uncharacterized protein n=1 Tax=Glossina brevipalpis TaxID=37001 RepID=A0A1A9WUH4_9MUSC
MTCFPLKQTAGHYLKPLYTRIVYKNVFGGFCSGIFQAIVYPDEEAHKIRDLSLDMQSFLLDRNLNEIPRPSAAHITETSSFKVHLTPARNHSLAIGIIAFPALMEDVQVRFSSICITTMEKGSLHV